MRDNLKFAEDLITYALENLELDERDVFCMRNRILEILSDIDPDEELTSNDMDELFGTLSLLPSRINEKFAYLAQKDGKSATDWFYNYCVKNDYVKKAVLDKNPRFEAEGLIVTINKAKPEFRDPKKAAKGNSVDGGFAKCVICRENEGFGARSKRTLRTVNLKLGGEDWFWQYSPYGYFNEHGIAVNTKHIPMHVDESTFGKLMDFVDKFPHYFLGCNAALPRIGGSVLAHDHYQGGGEVLPMQKAKAAFSLRYEGEKAAVEVLDWPGTVVRVVSPSRREIIKLSDIIRRAWVPFSDKELGIVAGDGEGGHNAVSPTVIKTARGYEMSIILRSNITSEKYPDGVFHAHPEYHVIKKESIGLIEAQGLFILPGRLEGQLSEIEKLIEGGKALPEELAEFSLVYDGVKEIYAAQGGNVHGAMQKELGKICFAILENTAVFKDKRQTVKFLQSAGFRLL